MYSVTKKSNNAIIWNNETATKVWWIGREEVFSHYKNLITLS